MQLRSIPSADAPDIFHRQPFQGGDAVGVVVDDATMAIYFELFREFGSDLGKGLIRGQSDADRHADGAPDAVVKVLAPRLEVDVLHAIEIDKALIDAVAEIGWGFLADDTHHPTREFPVQFIITTEYGDLFLRVLLGYLIIRRAILDAKGLCLVGSRHDTTVIVG